jgi:putative mRNA 3-end processing factor
MKIQKAGYHGLWFPELKLVLDGYHPDAGITFVSHAHADHMPRNRNAAVYTTEPTAELMKLRGFGGTTIPVGFGEWIEAERFRFRLYPAGHILGSAMIYIESDEGSLLYTGDYRTPPSPATEGFDAPERTDFLITEATFSLPIYKWKSNEELADEVRTFAQLSLDKGCTPIFLGYNLGKAQELMHLLAPLNHPIMIHGAGHKLCSVYTRHGFDLGNYSAYDRDTCEGKILVSPSSALSSGFASNVAKTRVAYCSGWAANESRRTQLTVDKLIPLSDHLDFFELIRFCEKLSPIHVWITHTPNPDVVTHYLENLGISSSFLELEYEAED